MGGIRSDSPVTRNALWLMGGRIYQALVNLAVSMLTARYLGPENFGLLQYAISLSSLFTAVCTLGLNSILVNELLRQPQKQDAVLGTAMGLRLLTGAASWVTVTALAAVLNPEEPLTVLVVFIYGSTLVFQGVDTLYGFYQSRLQNRVTVVITGAAYTAAALFRIALLMLGKDVPWFAGAYVLCGGLTALLLIVAYHTGASRKLCFERALAGQLLRRSMPFLLSGLMVALYGQMDRIMLKAWCGQEALGLYGAAAAIPMMWTFVLTAIIDSSKPVLLRQYGEDIRIFEAGLSALYSRILYLSLAAAVGITVLAGPVLQILYGVQFLEARGALRILCWGTGFSFLGVARSIWLIPQGKQFYEKYLAAVGIVCNFLLNWLWIPVWGIRGAAAATVLTQIVTNFLLGWVFPALRRNQWLILRGLGQLPRF